MAATDGRVIDPDALPRLLYIGDVAVADTMAGEALLYRLLQFYPPEKLAIVCSVRPDMPRLAGPAYHHWGAVFPRLLHSRVAEEYVLWRAWRYYEIPAQIARIATMFKAQAILSISHVSGWLAAWQLAVDRRIPLHLIAHDDHVYASRFPSWSRPWAERKFGEAYRAAAGRFCISDSMAAAYQQRYGVPAQVMLPTYKTAGSRGINERAAGTSAGLTFGYGGSIHSAEEMDQIIVFARCAHARGHRLMAFTPQHQLLSERATAAGVPLETHAPLHSDVLAETFGRAADCLLLPQSMAAAARPLVSTAFPSKWSDYSTLGLPVVVFAPAESTSARFVDDHRGCAALVTSADPASVDQVLAELESAPYRRSLAERLLAVGRDAFSPEAAWRAFAATLMSASKHGFSA